MQKIIEALRNAILDAKLNAPTNARLKRIHLPQKFTLDGIEVCFTAEAQEAKLYYEMDFPATQPVPKTT